ncbi:hypothetical protein B566_EDAN015599 [Ephemera danica]|nr:hypothetical protein B566_EDAN015599 [Ephemera danica]
MELKVWVEGIQRIICGVTEYTTCQDIVYALAHATGQTGRFTLIERWRNNDRLLAPHEHPLKILNKWGEYSNDVQFVLQRTSAPAANIGSPNTNASVLSDLSPTGKMSPSKVNANSTLLPTKDGNVLNEGQRSLAQLGNNISGGVTEPGRNIKKSLTISTGGGYQNHRVGVVRGVPQQKLLTLQPSPGLADVKSTSQTQDEELNVEQEDVPTGREVTTNITLTPQYKELLCLVNQQREKLGSLQADLTKYDAEIAFWESKTREQQHKAEFITQEGSRLQETSRVLEDQLMALKNIEEEKEISKQQSKTLKSEITLLRSKLANCMTLRLLEELQLEQRAAVQEEREEEEMRLHEQEQREAGNELLEQLEQLQRELEEAKTATARDMAAGNELDQEVEALELLIREKKQQVEQLVQDMKEANLHNLLWCVSTKVCTINFTMDNVKLEVKKESQKVESEWKKKICMLYPQVR